MSELNQKTKLLSLLTLVAAGFVCIFNEAEMNIALPALSQVYGIPVATTQWVTTGYMLVTGTFMPLAAWVMGRFGSRKGAIASLTILLVGILLAALAPNFGILLLGRLIQAFGCAFFIPIMMVVVMSLAPKEKFGTYNGIMMLVLMAAPALSPMIAGLILSTLGLKWMFFSIIPVLLLIILATVFLLPEVIEPRASRLDLLSVLFSILGFGGLVFAIANAASAGFASATTLLPLLIGALALLLYCRRQLRLENPLLRLQIFANRRYRGSITIVALLQAVLFGTILVVPLFLQEIWGLTAFEAGLATLPGGVATAIANLLAGMAYDRVSTKVVLPGLFLTAIGYIWVFFSMSAQLGLVHFILASCLYAFGLPFAMTALNSNGLSSLERQEYPDGSSLNNSILQVFGSLGTAIFTIVLYRSFSLPGNQSLAPLANGSEVAFLVSALMMLVTALLFLVLKPQDR